MKQFAYEASYRNLTLKKINTPEYSHLFMLLYWAIYGVVFQVLEKIPGRTFHVIECGFDNVIPFCEYFVIPYYFWFAYIIGYMLYSLACNIDGFKRFMWYIIITNTITWIIYIVYPSAQNLRPTEFETDSIFIDIVKNMYRLDTNTNVCPSLHVINTMAVTFSLWKDKYFNSLWQKTLNVVIAISICVSTVFLKQHSIIDIIAAFILSAACYPFAFTDKFYIANIIKLNKKHI